MKCKFCGVKLQPSAKRCRKCGRHLKRASWSPPASGAWAGKDPGSADNAPSMSVALTELLKSFGTALLLLLLYWASELGLHLGDFHSIRSWIPWSTAILVVLSFIRFLRTAPLKRRPAATTGQFAKNTRVRKRPL